MSLLRNEKHLFIIFFYITTSNTYNIIINIYAKFTTTYPPTYLHLEILNCNCHVLDQSRNLFRSLCISVKLGDMFYIFVSSAKNLQVFLRQLGRSFIKIKNNIGPNILP